MKNLNTKSLMLTKEQATAQRKWVCVDAAGIPIGRLATRVAHMIRGKHKPNFTPHVDGGDFVIVLNAEKVVLTGRKLENKFYHRFSGYIGGMKSEAAKDLIERKPEYMIRQAVEGMLPSGILAHRMMKKLKVFRGTEHPHQAQMPEIVELPKR